MSNNISPKVVFHRNAIVYPISDFDLQRREFNGGVLTEQGLHCPLSEQIKAGYKNRLGDSLALPQKKVSGRFLYAGMMQNRHFGHFLIESLSRLWASTEINRLDGIVFILRSPQAEIAQFAKEIIELFLQDMPIYVVKEPSQFEELIISEQICQARQGILLKHDVFEPLFSKFRSAFQEPTNAYPNKVYVSRSKLNGNEGLVLAERIFETNLEVEGYTVIHPQELSVNEQLNFYANAEKLIFSDGSAFHLYILVAQQFQDCFIVWRRKKHNDFDIQLKSFVGKSTYGKPFLDGYFTPVNEAHNSARHKAKLDYEKLKSQLVEDGFIHGDGWEVPVERDFTEEIELLEKRLKKRLVYVEEKSL
ncbi:MAG: hypothetical protein ACI83B_003314 [Sediminicola sp.]|jgi:hypothetical protein